MAFDEAFGNKLTLQPILLTAHTFLQCAFSETPANLDPRGRGCAVVITVVTAQIHQKLILKKGLLPL